MSGRPSQADRLSTTDGQPSFGVLSVDRLGKRGRVDPEANRCLRVRG